jgi:enoyl-CoA hydratase/carnithine racemase
VGWISIDRPPLNIVTAAMARDMRAGVEALDADTTSSVIAVSAAGEKAFAAGADVGEHSLERVRELNDELFALARVLLRPDGKPRVAVVKGICSGGANEIAFACDFVVAHADTRFSLPEIKLGAAGNFGAFLMSRVMPPAKALELALTGEWMSAQEALGFGLVTRVLPTESFDQAVQDYLGKFTDKSIAALRLGRRHFRQIASLTTEEGLNVLPRLLMDEAIQLEDYKEGVDAFLARRKPVWRHR